MKTSIRITLLAMVLTCVTHWLHAQCLPSEALVAITIVPDQFPNETTWELRDNQGNLLGSGIDALGDTLCVDSSLCLEFTIFDSYGDGICCAYGVGSYEVHYNGTLVAAGGAFSSSEKTMFGTCPPGSNCAFGDTISTGPHIAPNRNYWYSWTPDSTGTYEITTCSTNTCNTVIWVYDHCLGLEWDNSNQGTVFYNDNDCALQARVVGHFAGGVEYWIRIGDAGNNCSGPINWALNYLGPVVGCTDTLACNYNPLATVTDTCLYPGDTLCPDGPDLTVEQNVVESSMMLDVLPSADPCLVTEGCLTGYGTRDLIRFTTHIKNIGNQDFYIGDPNQNPQMFQFDVCHNHYHFQGYAEYVLYDSASQPLPIGFKNGFCVLDLECSGGGTAQYGCGNMGISTGCGDIYDRSLECQWIDITDVQSGSYTLVVRVNWNRLDDALGRTELDFNNNWAQVCFDLVKDPVPGGHNHQLTINPVCPSIVDCNGVVFGSAVYDCEGVCDGTALRGDLDANLAQETVDGSIYVADILGNNTTLSSCTDLNNDGEITVSDAALINACALRGDNYQVQGGGIHDYCSDLPIGILNINDTVHLRLGTIDYNNQTLDIEVRNPDCRIAAYQFEVDGLVLTSADNMIPLVEYPNTVQTNAAGTVISLTAQDSSIDKSTAWRVLTRLHYSSITGAQICIDPIVDIVNSNYEDVLHVIEGSCITIVGSAEPAGPYQVTLFPNPFDQMTTLQFEMLAREKYSLELLDLQGRVVRDYGQLHSNRVEILRGDLSTGMYYYRLTGKTTQVGKLVVL
jgi:hypothetical protein